MELQYVKCCIDDGNCKNKGSKIKDKEYAWECNGLKNSNFCGCSGLDYTAIQLIKK